MTKSLLEISLSIFLIACSVVLISIAINGKTIVESYVSAKTEQIELANELKKTIETFSSKYFSMLETQSQAQKSLIETSKKINSVIFEAGLAFGARALEEERAISPSDSNKIITQSLDNIMKESDRLGLLAKALNDASRRR
jgi:NhaP-type Na+/H+ and K+/H+ antiporter